MSNLRVEAAATDIMALLAPIPEGFTVSIDDEHNAILIGSDALAFAVTQRSIEDGVALDQVKQMWPALLLELSQRFAIMAGEFKIKMEEQDNVEPNRAAQG